jgi:putative ATP-binding cassette transporter
MSEKKAAGRETLRRLGRVVRHFLASSDGTRAKLLLALLFTLMLAINGMNVINSYVGRDFFSAIEERDHAGFVRQAWLYVAVFAASTGVGVCFRYAEERLALLWREWQTQRAARAYLERRIYLHVKETGSISNPDQRIAEDIRTMTTTTLSFLLMIFNGTFTAIAFSGVLWTISPKLFAIAVLYAAAGSTLTIWLGRPLIRLNYQQADREADFRSELIYVHQNAEGLAFARDESRMSHRLALRIEHLVGNFRRIIAVNRNLNFFTSGYNYMIQLIPALFVAPMFISHDVEFGVIGQSTMAFATLVGAFSLVITQFQSISSYASVVTRLSEMVDALDAAIVRDERSCLDCRMEADRIVFTHLNLHAAEPNGRVLIRGLDATLPPHGSLLVTGENQSAKSALIRAIAGLHESGSGGILRPPPGKTAFLLEQPYLPHSTLRELLAPPGAETPPTDEEILAILDELGLEITGARQHDFDTPRRWTEAMNLCDEQLLALARALLTQPDFLILEHFDSALDPEQYRTVRRALTKRGIACMAVGNGKAAAEPYDAKLELFCDGTWKWTAWDSSEPPA